MWPFTPGTWARALRFTKPSAAVCCAGSVSTPAGEKLLALVDLGGVTLELIQSPTPVSMEEGNLPHFAIYVDDVDAAAADLRSAGVDTFLTPEKRVVPGLFGGLENWFFTGPSGEQIELLKML